MKKLVSSTLIILVLLVSCKKKPSSARVETINGVTHIYCSETPLHPEKNVAFEEELTISGRNENNDIILYQPSRYIVDADDNIYISDQEEQNIKVFDKNGKYLKTIGSKGKGPGEFESIASMAFLPDGRLLVLDWRNRRTSFFDSEGKFISSLKWRASHYYIYMTSESTWTTDERIYGEKTQLFVKTYDFSGKELVSFGEFTPYGFQTMRMGNISYAISLPFSPFSVFTADQDQMWLYHLFNSKYLIEVYDRNGNLFRKISRPYTPVRFTEKDAEEYRSGFDNNPNKVFAKMAREVELPKIKTISERMLVDDLGNLWVETNEEKEQNGDKFIAYDIFNRDGFYDARVWCSIRPGLFVRGKMYRLDTDRETGFRTLKRYRIIWKES